MRGKKESNIDKRKRRRWRNERGGWRFNGSEQTKKSEEEVTSDTFLKMKRRKGKKTRGNLEFISSNLIHSDHFYIFT